MKIRLTTIGVFFFTSLIYAQTFYNSVPDLYAPKINHGELFEKDVNELESILGLISHDITAIPEVPYGKIFYEYQSVYDHLTGFIPLRIYEQKIENVEDRIFRVLFQPFYYENRLEDFSYEKIYCRKKGESKAHLCFEGFITYQEYGWQSDLPEVFGGTMLIIRNGSFDGVMLYRLRYQTRYGGQEDDSGKIDKTHEAFVYFFDGRDSCQAFADEEDIKITASWPLLNDDDLFHYTIQNAFDQNPATSYVEDTEDDLINIEFIRNNNLGKLSTWKIINGYRLNDDFYFENNRVKTLSKFFYSFYHKNISFQWNNNTFTYTGKDGEGFTKGEKYGNEGHFFYFKVDDIYNKVIQIPGALGMDIHVTEIYRGSKYSDTAISDIDYKFGDVWLFGGNDE